MSQEFTLPLSGLNCGKCVAKVEHALSTNTGISQYSVTKTELTLTTVLSKKSIIEIITQLGFSVLQTKTIALYLSGLNCGKCVKKATEALETLGESEIITISTTEVVLNTGYSQDHIINLIQSIGFNASESPFSSKKENIESSSEALDNTTLEQDRQSNINKTTQFILSGMTCASCVASVEKIISDTNNVQSVRVNLAERTALVTGDINEMEVIQAIEKGGYGAEISLSEEQRRKRQKELYLKTTAAHKKNTIVSLTIGAPLMLWGVFGGNMQINTINDQLAWGFVGLICLGLLLTAGRHFFINAWKAFTHHRATMDTLVALGTGSAWLYSMALVISPEFFPEQARHVYFEATAMILGLITLGNLIETKARNRTSSAIEKLLNLQPQTAIVIQDGKEVELPVSQVLQGMIIKIKPGQKIPVDGVLISGESYLDEAMLTGEPLPNLKTTNDTVQA